MDDLDRNAQHHDLIKFTLRKLGFAHDREDPSGLADWWVHPTLGEFMVIRPAAGDYWTRMKELVGDLAQAHECPDPHELQTQWLVELGMKVEAVKPVVPSSLQP